MSSEFVDYQYLASLERHPRRKRLLSAKQFEVMETNAVLAPLLEGTRPIFTKAKYDSVGREVREKLPKDQEPEQEQSFFRKYWLYILLAFMILPNILGGGQPEEG